MTLANPSWNSRSGVGAVGEQLLEKRELSEHRGQHHQPAIAILDIGGGDQRVQQQAQRIDEDVALLAFDQLAGVEPMGIDAGPPFSALFTLWLSEVAPDFGTGGVVGGRLLRMAWNGADDDEERDARLTRR